MRYVLMFLLTFCVVPISAQRTTVAVPVNADTVSYPFMKGVLTTAEMANLHLRPVTLDTATAAFNWYRDKGRFIYETLPAGTVVLVDTLGVIRYKADCGNRLVTIAECPRCISTTPPVPVADSSLLPREPSAWSKFWRSIGDTILGILKFLLALLLLVLAGLLALWLLGSLIAWLSGFFGGRDGSTSPDDDPETGRGREPSTSAVMPIAGRRPRRAEELREERAGSGQAPATAPAPPPVPFVGERSVNLAIHRDGTFVVRASRGITEVRASRVGENTVRVDVDHE